jgi:hypothetical protein
MLGFISIPLRIGYLTIRSDICDSFQSIGRLRKSFSLHFSPYSLTHVEFEDFFDAAYRLDRQRVGPVLTSPPES